MLRRIECKCWQCSADSITAEFKTSSGINAKSVHRELYGMGFYAQAAYVFVLYMLTNFCNDQRMVDIRFPNRKKQLQL